MAKTVLITGCSTGLGYISAQKFADEGWNVIATMRKPDGRIAEGHPDQFLVTALDVTSPASIEAAISAGISRFGQIDAVVNNAGITTLSIFEATPMELIRELFETNVFGVMNVIQAITPYLRKQGGGSIVNVCSSVGYAASPLLSIYTATKHTIEGLSESLAYELESQNIRIKLVEPGAMRNTNFTSSRTAGLNTPIPIEYKSYFDQMMDSMINHYPFEDAEEEQVAALVYKAACDGTDRLRYPAGAAAEEMARLRWSSSEDEFMSTMRDLLGQTSWRQNNKS
ncbi:SDR family oxidoreductase [Paenibacillus tritici]|uniref:SDR family oxidoreductase n=1 Tax=Paenibacillus tritici TaxID=1873425 RepID=A0ABX2DM10_9BACL|nr:SDR family oxidoreductase [Paenibacillus tritici]NQX45475.1 SDR family oxidoreductase [Paenibacillus tritici]QUL56325.1 SDR family oxidoreductase [Paenibacillus tritici]